MMMCCKTIVSFIMLIFNALHSLVKQSPRQYLRHNLLHHLKVMNLPHLLLIQMCQ